MINWKSIKYSAKASTLAYRQPKRTRLVNKLLCPESNTLAYSWITTNDCNSNSNKLYITFKGSSTTKDLFDSIDCHKYMYNEKDNIQIHKGFWNKYTNLRLQLYNLIYSYSNKVNEIICTGHSLGAALASICALDIYYTFQIKASLHTFGSPRVGNVDFADMMPNILNEHYRVTYMDDVVSHIPMGFEYRHIYGNHIHFLDDEVYVIQNDDKREFTTDMIGLSMITSHTMVYYIQALSNKVSGGNVPPLPPRSLR